MIVIFVFLFASNVSFAGNKQALSYGVLTRKGFCSSTLVKVGGKCHIVTNAHCLAEGESEVLLKSASDYLPISTQRWRVYRRDISFLRNLKAAARSIMIFCGDTKGPSSAKKKKVR